LGRIRSGWRSAAFLFAFVVSAIVTGTLGQIALSTLQIDPRQGPAVFLTVNAILTLIPALIVGWGCGKLFESLPYRAIGAALTSGWLKHFAVGNLFGTVMLGVAVILAMAFGGLRFVLNPEADASSLLTSLGVSFAVFAAASAFEESLFRGYILQTFARSGLAWLAILLTAAFFGAVHTGNPGAGIISTANTVIAGVWFGVAYLKTRDLWFVWGLHLMWNFAQGSIFGIEVSGLTGIANTTLLKEIDRGPEWLTGGPYGIEGGIVCTVALIASGLAIHFIPFTRPDAEMLAMTGPPKPITN